MSTYVPAGASMPQGIEVDETAAYFGITGASDLLLSLNSMSRLDALKSFLERISDLLLKGVFDLDTASERLEVESGEIYYILSGPLNLLEVTQPLREFLGLGEGAGAPPSDISTELLAGLEALLDPMELLRIYATGDVVGGAAELNKYVLHLESMLADPAGNVEELVTIHHQMNEILSETMQMSMPRPIEALARRPDPPPLPTPAPAQPANQIPQSPPQPQQPSATVVPTQIPRPLQHPSLEPAQDDSHTPPASSHPEPTRSGPASLIEAQPLQRPASTEPDPPPADPSQPDLTPIEADALNPQNWMLKPETPSQTEPEDDAAGQRLADPHPAPLQPVRDTQTQELPKPVRPSKQQFSDGSASNGIARAFPQGRLCKGCAVSQSGSWRYCPLCGHDA